MVPPCSDRVSRAPPYSNPYQDITHTGLSPIIAGLSRPFCFSLIRHWPAPRSLATTSGISVDVFSSGYLDVSVPRVRLIHLCIQCMILLRGGCPIRTSTDQSLFAAPHGFSQRTTSFIASQCQGIHRTPFSFSHYAQRSQALSKENTQGPEHMHRNQPHPKMLPTSAYAAVSDTLLILHHLNV